VFECSDHVSAKVFGGNAVQFCDHCEALWHGSHSQMMYSCWSCTHVYI